MNAQGSTVFAGGAVLPGGPRDRPASALAMCDGRIVALGDDALALRGAGSAEVDLAGGALLPAFADGHAHPCHGGTELLDAPVRDLASVAEVVTAVGRHAADHPTLDWILGGSYDATIAPGGVFGARWLDAAVPDRPVLLTSADHHTAWVNTEALRRAGIDADTPDPPGGRIARREDGSPLGTLIEWTAMDLVRRHVPARSEADEMAGLEAAGRLLAAAGIAWVQDAISTPADVTRCAALADAGRLPVRMNLALRADPGSWEGQRDAFRAARDAVAGHPDVTARTVKLFADGVIEHGSAALIEPYADEPGTCGMPVWEPAELAAAAAALDADGFQLHIHAIGDAGIRSALDAIEHAAAVNGPRDRRPVIAHLQLPHPKDLPRLAALGVTSVCSPLWACRDTCMSELTEPRLGPERSAWQYPLASLLASGARLSFGSDWPVSSLRPLDGLAVAITRQTPAGEPAGGWLPRERLSLPQALSAYTAAVALQSFEERSRGWLHAGMRADLLHLAADPASIPPRELASVEVLGTWLGGRRTA